MKPLEGNMTGTPRPEPVSTKQERIAELARNCPDMAIHESGITSTWNGCSQPMLEHAKTGPSAWTDKPRKNTRSTWRPTSRTSSTAQIRHVRRTAVRRVHIPKAGSVTETRPLGIPTYEDKILQRAVLMVLEPVYETDFLDVSHGVRPGRGAHGALDSLWTQEMKLGGGWIVDVDLRKFFDTIDHGHLREFLKRRVRDGVILRLIGKWLNAGVLDKGVLTISEEGTPQGGVISPPTILRNLGIWRQ